MEDIAAAACIFGADEREVDWAMMVKYARRESRYSRCVPEKTTRHIIGLGEQPIASA